MWGVSALYSQAAMAKPEAVAQREQEQDFSGDCQLSNYISHQVFMYMLFVLGSRKTFSAFKCLEIKSRPACTKAPFSQPVCAQAFDDSQHFTRALTAHMG